MRHGGRALVLAWAAALVLSSCGGGGGGADQPSDSSTSATSESAPTATGVADSSEVPTTDALAVDGAVDIEALEALADEFAALDEEQQFDRLNEMSGQLERDLFNLSDLEAAVGGSQAVDASITETGFGSPPWPSRYKIPSCLSSSNHKGSAPHPVGKPTEFRASGWACSAG